VPDAFHHGQFVRRTLHMTGRSHGQHFACVCECDRLYVSTSKKMFLMKFSKKNRTHPHCMHGAFRIGVTRTPHARCIFFGKAFDVMYTFRNLGRLPKIQNPKQRCQYSGQAAGWTVRYSNATMGKRCISFQTLRPALDPSSLLFKKC